VDIAFQNEELAALFQGCLGLYQCAGGFARLDDCRA
jgi:hypothetical protein